MDWAHILLLCGTVGFLVSSSAAVPTTKHSGLSLPPPAASHSKPSGNKSNWQNIQDVYFELTNIRNQLSEAQEQLREAYDNNDYDAARELAEQIRGLQQQLQEAYNHLNALTG
ncbi:uncharacterized protein LOC118413980 [Branchiostoma floridae]|uniref:Uncharacterized protein LOC118413980 n=1 Tax=Branchiostoma floridae TaxID=7739 RepID=A0A9J7KZY1_BRAFL|nr:uncharacterized protein LOC118413980 [Branchiostoma floridae]XP_035673567.1 uncharacterized protein LOC118413980 [Branchiostoma floridae]